MNGSSKNFRLHHYSDLKEEDDGVIEWKGSMVLDDVEEEEETPSVESVNEETMQSFVKDVVAQMQALTVELSGLSEISRILEDIHLELGLQRRWGNMLKGDEISCRTCHYATGRNEEVDYYRQDDFDCAQGCFYGDGFCNWPESVCEKYVPDRRFLNGDEHPKPDEDFNRDTVGRPKKEDDPYRRG